METLLRVSELSMKAKKRDQWLFKDVQFTIHSGEKVAIVGGAGSGKTCLAEMVVGLKKPDRGFVERKGGVAYVPQKFMLYGDLTVGENMEFTCGINNYDAIAVDTIMKKMGLEGYERVRANRLPHGMQKMLQYACALCRDFSVMIIDEPMVGLDDSSRERVEKLMSQLIAEGKGLLVLANTDAETGNADYKQRLVAVNDGMERTWRHNFYPEPNGVRE
jgi:ABC-2 type transport system ATP-binding protein